MSEAALGTHTPGIRWPGEAQWSAYTRLVGVFCLFFFPVFFGVGALAVHFGRSMPLYLEWETRIPCIPSMVWIYLSANALWVLPLIHLTARQIDSLSRQVSLIILIAGAGYLALPGQVGYPAAAYPGLDGAIIAKLDELAAMSGHNLVPSLHVAFGTIILASCMRIVSRPLSFLYGAWLILLSLSTVLTHQHHLLDIATGFALALAVRWLLPTAKRF